MKKLFQIYSLYYFLIALVDIFFRKIRKVIFKHYFPHSNSVNIGSGSNIVGIKHISIGNNFFCRKHLRMEAIDSNLGGSENPKIIIKDSVVINDFVQIGATNYIEIGNNTIIANKVTILDHNHGYYNGEDQDSPTTPPNKRKISTDGKIVIGDNVWLSDSVTILGTVNIGEGSIIGAGSIVTSDIPSNCIAVGTPAKVIKCYSSETKKWENI